MAGADASEGIIRLGNQETWLLVLATLLNSCVTSSKVLPLAGSQIFTEKIKGLVGLEFKCRKLIACGLNIARDLLVCFGQHSVF